MLTLDQALEETRTGDLWLFRGGSRPDRAIQTLTNAPVNHVGMTVAIDDLPPLIWHAELGDKLVDMWTATNHRGVQLNDLREAVLQWSNRYHQRCWLRQLTPYASREQENKLLRVIARTPRCAVPTLAHGALPRDTEALRVLARHNRVQAFPDSNPEPCAGVYAAVLRPGRIRAGDPVRMVRS